MRWVWRDEAQGRWTSYDVPDFPATKLPLDERDPNGVGMVELPGTWAFILMLEGLDWLYVPTGSSTDHCPRTMNRWSRRSRIRSTARRRFRS